MAGYSDEVRAQAVQMVREGVEYIDVTIALGPSESTLRAWAREGGVPPRSRAHVVPYFSDDVKALARRMRAAGHTVAEVMAKTGASRHSIWKWTLEVAG